MPRSVLFTVIILDTVVLAVFLMDKAQTDMLLLYAAAAGLVIIFLGKRLFLRHVQEEDG